MSHSPSIKPHAPYGPVVPPHPRPLKPDKIFPRHLISETPSTPHAAPPDAGGRKQGARPWTPGAAVAAAADAGIRPTPGSSELRRALAALGEAPA